MHTAGQTYSFSVSQTVPKVLSFPKVENRETFEIFIDLWAKLIVQFEEIDKKCRYYPKRLRRAQVFGKKLECLPVMKVMKAGPA